MLALFAIREAGFQLPVKYDETKRMRGKNPHVTLVGGSRLVLELYMYKRVLLGCSALLFGLFALGSTQASACGAYYGYGAGCGCGYAYYAPVYYARPAYAYYAPAYYARPAYTYYAPRYYARGWGYAPRAYVGWRGVGWRGRRW